MKYQPPEATQESLPWGLGAIVFTNIKINRDFIPTMGYIALLAMAKLAFLGLP